MGIARRKAGTVVSCPQCHGQVVVPVPAAPVQPTVMAQAGTPPAVLPKGNVFERQDFDANVFEPVPVKAPGDKAVEKIRQTPPTAGIDVEMVNMHAPASPEPLPEPEKTLTKARTITRLLLAGLVLAALAFAAGFVVGKMTDWPAGY